MRLPRLLHSSAARLALRYALLYALVLGVALAALWVATRWYADSRLEAQLERELESLSQAFEAGGSEGLRTALARPAEDRLYLLLSRSGEKLGGNLRAWPDDAELALDGEAQSTWVEEAALPIEQFDENAYLPVAATAFADGSRLLLSHRVQQAVVLQEIAGYLLESLPVALLLSLALGLSLSRAMQQRMDAIGRTAGEIMAGDLSQRVPLSARQDEFDALAMRLNGMLDRIQQLIKGLHEVTDNIAHDLRSPLTRLRNRLEVTLLEPRAEAEYRQVIQQGIEDAASLIQTFNALLGVAQTEAGNHRGEWTAVDLSALLHDLADLYTPAAEDRQLRLELALQDGVSVVGSRDLLAQAVGNLLENAIKYTPEQGCIRLQLRADADGVELAVSDSGAGIPAAEREHVLERFVRLENSRHTAGNGLGLSLVRAVAKLHQAELRLGDAHPGLRVSLHFPPGALPKAV